MKREFVKAVDSICEGISLSRGTVFLVGVEEGKALFAVRESRTILGTFTIQNSDICTKGVIEAAEQALEVSTAGAVPSTMNHALGISSTGMTSEDEEDLDEEETDEGLATTTALNQDNDVGQIDQKWVRHKYQAQHEAAEGRLYNVFVYGDLVDADLRAELFGEDVPFEIAQLDDFMLANHVATDGGVLVNVHMQKGQKVVGLILTLTQDQLNLADEQMDGYSRMVYPVQGEQCFVYFVRPEAVQEEVTPAKKGDVNSLELRVGTDVEREHTDLPAEAQKVALQHLAEFPDYYRRMYRAGLIKKDEVGEGNWKELVASWGKPTAQEECTKIVTFFPNLKETVTFCPARGRRRGDRRPRHRHRTRRGHGWWQLQPSRRGR
jgi:hypothetical protein